MNESGQLDALNDRLEDLEYLYENAACGYLTVNEHLNIERINTTALTWLGYADLTEIESGSATTLVAPADRSFFKKSIQTLCAQPALLPERHPISLHMHLYPHSGTSFPSLLHLSLAARQNPADTEKNQSNIDIAIFHLGHQESLLDVLTTTRAKLEDAHAQVELADSRLEVIAETTPDAIITLDAQQVVLFANPAAESMFKLDRSSLVGQPIDQLIPAQIRESHRSHVLKFGRDGQTRRKTAGHLKVEGLRADGTQFPIDASISRFFIDGMVHYTAILRDVSERVATEQALDSVRQKVRRYAARLRSVREDEQKRISRELHDDIGQRLTALQLDIYKCESELKSGAAGATEKLRAISRQTSEIIDSVRAIATQLRPKVLDELGLAPALEIYLTDLGERHAIAHTLRLAEDLDLNQTISTEIFRLIQEATHNIVKHAQATHLTVTIEASESGVHLAIRDNGQGIRQKEPRHDALGLIGMQERASSLGGHVTVTSSMGKGTLVECFLPYSTNQSRD